MASLVTNVSFFFFAAFLIQFSRGRSYDEKSHLEAAMARGDIEKARALIRGGALEDYPGLKDREKIYSKLRFIQILLENHIVKINKKDNDLKKAPREEGSFDVVLIPGTALVTRVCVNVTTLKLWGNKTIKDGRKPIHVICLLPEVSPSIVQIFLENGKDDVNTKTASGATPLMLAAISGNLELVKFLVERGARVNDIASSMFEGGEEINGHFAFAKIFSKSKLKPSTSQLDYTALVSAFIVNNSDIIKYLLSKGADVSNNGQGWLTLFHAVNVNRTDLMEILLRNGLDVNCKDMLGSTALHKAAEIGNIEIAKFLLKNGANLNATDSLGWTPLHVASFFSRFGGNEMIQFLVKAGSDIDRLTDGGYSPLNLVEAGFNPLFLPFLVKNIDCLNKTENYKDLPEEESNKRHTEIVDSVIQLGASLNHQDSILGWSTLHWAAASGDLDVAKLLVKYGAVISSRDKWDRNPLETAVHFGRPRVVEFLKTARDLVL